jgi:hypothetical protein
MSEYESYSHSGKTRLRVGRQGVKPRSKRRTLGRWLYEHFDSILPKPGSWNKLDPAQQEKWCDLADRALDSLRRTKSGRS